MNAALAATLHPRSPGGEWLVHLTLAVLLVLTAWILFQTIHLPLALPVNDAWRDLPAIMGLSANTISVAPADTVVSLLRVTMPMAAFLTAFLISSSDEHAMQIIRRLGVIGGMVGIFGLGQFLFFPHMLLLGEKQHYFDSLTAVFTNRNTAATFLGLATLILVTQAWERLRGDTHPVVTRPARMRPNSPRSGLAIGTILYLLALACTFSALMLTRSRAGVASTFVALLYLLPFLAGNWRPRGPDRLLPRDFGACGRYLLMGLAALVTLLGILAFAGQPLLRTLTRGFEDGRFCVLPGVLDALSAHWVTGTGFGTFTSVFPGYRDPACGIAGVWDRTHNSYLEGFLGLGFVFPLVLFAGLATLLRVLQIGMAERRSLRHYPALGIASLILVALHSALDFSLQIPGFALYFSALMGAIAAISLGRHGKSQGFKDSPAEIQSW
ncbi:O-antigen ligase family protein [Rhizobium sp. BK251]|uniref:O-antigen ligase family protein n=1 Tax=Rhizobium sp. BK251 TaxID=2512125 RepID=UPI0014050CB4|nr:O-antigen ligase family protein [Rhizobium sp. BK251]